MLAAEITPDVARLRVSFANVYFVGSPGSPWVLVDAGFPGRGGKIRAAADARYGAGARPVAILLTHGHYDHSGSARELAAAWDVFIYAHRLEIPFLSGRATYPPADPAVGGFLGLFSRFMPGRTIDVGDRLRELPDGEAPGLPGWLSHHTPGHAPGHVAFSNPQSSVLLSGDAVITVDYQSFIATVSNRQEVSGPPAPFTCDWVQARRSAELLASLKANHIAAGHGSPMSGQAAVSGLSALARNFPVPKRGRYTVEPARTDATGIVYLPPEIR